MLVTLYNTRKYVCTILHKTSTFCTKKPCTIFFGTFENSYEFCADFVRDITHCKSIQYVNAHSPKARTHDFLPHFCAGGMIYPVLLAFFICFL